MPARPPPCIVSLLLLALFSGACGDDAALTTAPGWIFHEFPDETKAPELRDYAEELHQAGVDGLEILVLVCDEAVELWRDAEDLTPMERMDAAMRDVSIVILGGASLAMVQLLPVRPGLIGRFHRELSRLHEEFDLNQLMAFGVHGVSSSEDLINQTPNIDPGRCDGFRDELCDDTANQVHHTWAYVYITYVTGNPLVTHIGNVHHERSAESGSLPDLRAGYWGAQVGMALRLLRSGSWLAPSVIDEIPFLTGSVLARGAATLEGMSYGDPAYPINAGVDRSASAERIDNLVASNVDGLGGDRLVMELMHRLCDCTDSP